MRFRSRREGFELIEGKPVSIRVAKIEKLDPGVGLYDLPSLHAEGLQPRFFSPQVLHTKSACIFDRYGYTGIWDVLHAQVGARSKPAAHMQPWPIGLRNGVQVTVARRMLV